MFPHDIVSSGNIFLDPVPNSNQGLLGSLYRDFSKEKQTEVSIRTAAAVYVKPTPVPAIISRDLFEWSQAAAQERALAVSAFLRDVYHNSEPTICSELPQLAFVLRDNPYYLARLVGEPVCALPWNVEMAMDWTISRNKDGTVTPVIIENDTCAIGGLLTLAVVFEALRKEWIQCTSFSEFEDGTAYLTQLLERLSKASEAYYPGRPLIFAENCLDPYVEEDSAHWLHQVLVDSGFLVAGKFNRWRLEFDGLLGKYRLDGIPASLFMLHYYPCVFDRTYPEYALMPDFLKDETQGAHAVDGSWGNYINGGYNRWLQTNPLGAEVFCDKATSAFLPDMVRFYLKREPLISTDTYQHFVDEVGMARRASIDQVFDNPTAWIVKPRRDSGQGVGVFFGTQMENGTTMHGKSWYMLRTAVLANPLNYIAQPLIDEIELTLPNGTRGSVEFRNIVHTLADTVIPVNQLFVRAAPISQAEIFRLMASVSSSLF